MNKITKEIKEAIRKNLPGQVADEMAEVLNEYGNQKKELARLRKMVEGYEKRLDTTEEELKEAKQKITNTEALRDSLDKREVLVEEQFDRAREMVAQTELNGAITEAKYATKYADKVTEFMINMSRSAHGWVQTADTFKPNANENSRVRFNQSKGDPR